jgi:hypothetical protein
MRSQVDSNSLVPLKAVVCVYSRRADHLMYLLLLTVRGVHVCGVGALFGVCALT